jgi:hypothetical protein
MAKRRPRLGKRFRRPELLEKVSQELVAPGEVGRAIPGLDQTQLRVEARARVPVGEPVIPPPEGRTEINTYFTKVGGDHLLYQAESWVIIRLMLEGAGPVDVGTRDQIAPVLSGKGISLPQNVEIAFPLAKGNRIWITANTINRVRRIIQPVPHENQRDKQLGSILALLQKGR